jgi:type II secretory pathway component PulC
VQHIQQHWHIPGARVGELSVRAPVAFTFAAMVAVGAAALLYTLSRDHAETPLTKATAETPAIVSAPRSTRMQEPAAAPDVPGGLVAVGVIASDDPSKSRALIEIGSLGVQEYRLGDAVSAGWVIARITSDSVALRNGAVERSISVSGGAAQPAVPVTASTSRSADAAVPLGRDKPEPGFAANTPGLGISAEAAHESNQRFLNAMQERKAQGH